MDVIKEKKQAGRVALIAGGAAVASGVGATYAAIQNDYIFMQFLGGLSGINALGVYASFKEYRSLKNELELR